MLTTLVGCLRLSTLFKKQTFSLIVASNILSTALMSTTTTANAIEDSFDPIYPGTAVTRMLNIRERVKSLTSEQLNGDWDSVRLNILWAGGLKDLRSSRPGEGYTGHSFNDFNHCDLTAMRGDEADNENNGRVKGIHRSNPLGRGIKIASLKDAGPGGSWSTCMIGCASEPPQDVAHIQFKSRIAFKVVWVPPTYKSFVLIDDDGVLLNHGTPTAGSYLPNISERQENYAVVAGSKYAVEADKYLATTCATSADCK